MRLVEVEELGEVSVGEVALALFVDLVEELANHFLTEVFVEVENDQQKLREVQVCILLEAHMSEDLADLRRLHAGVLLLEKGFHFLWRNDPISLLIHRSEGLEKLFAFLVQLSEVDHVEAHNTLELTLGLELEEAFYDLRIHLLMQGVL